MKQFYQIKTYITPCLAPCEPSANKKRKEKNYGKAN